MHAKNIVFDFDTIASTEDFYAACKEKLALPDYFGNNLDALYDCLTGYIDLPIRIKFIHLSKEQRAEFASAIKTFEDAHNALKNDFIFNFK